MNSKFIKKKIKYTGAELAPHWIYKNHGLEQDSIVSFIGEADVKLTEMVDLEDVIKNEPIYSPLMLNFIIEYFEIGLFEGVLLQRLLINIIKEVLEIEIPKIEIRRDGDDLYVENKKLSVSIATKSLTSVLIHVGLNIDSKGTPIPTCGLLTDLWIADSEMFAKMVMNRYTEEVKSIKKAICKVRGVF